MTKLLPLLLLSAVPITASAQHAHHLHESARDVAGHEDYRHAVGRTDDGVLRVTLDVGAATWRPWGPDGPALDAHVFVPEGAAAKIPGPLLRVTAGTPIYVTLRNTLGDTLMVRGLRDRGQQLPPGAPPAAGVALPFVGDSVVVAPGATADVRFTPTVPGSYFYFGKTFAPGWSATPQPLFGARGVDRALVGVLIVDPAGVAPDPNERILLISHWAETELPASFLPAARFFVNGRSWPHTERLVYAQHDTVRWRVINQSGAFHPMHLHGFYFQVDDWSDQRGARLLQAPGTPLAVTWPMPPTSTLRMSWVAHEPGNWIFHCHLMRHMSWIQSAPFDAEPGASHAHRLGEGVDLMGGLVLGITVKPATDYTQAPDVTRRRLRLHITKRDRVFGDEPGYGFVLQDGARPPAPDSVRFPGSPIVLTRGEPTQIVVHNRADVALGVHWHGLELESWADGVPGWSGMPGSPVPAIAPGDSLTVRMTPPRAGTFMYHVHSEPGHQLALGLHGKFLVLEPGTTWDRETDLVLLLSSLGAGDDPPPAVNGRHEPEPLELRAGTTYRFRFMHISPDDNKTVQLLDGDRPVQWRFVARDGADLPPEMAVMRPANLPFVDVGTTLDFLYTPEQPGELTLRIVTEFDGGLAAFPRPAPEPHVMEIPVRVR